MPETRPLLERVMERVELRPFTLERFHDRRDRKRRNQRIAARVVGIAVFVAAVWIVTSGLSFDRTQTPAAPGSETGPTQTAPRHAPASAGPDEWVVGTCNDGARGQLKLTVMGDRIRVWFEVHRSPVGHRWLIGLRHHSSTVPFPPPWPNAFVFFHGTRVASDSGVLAVQASIADRTGVEGYAAFAIDKQTGQVCRGSTWF
jgi:hypothetical protein